MVVLGVIATAVALFFYARVIYYMYMKEPEAVPLSSDSGWIGRGALLVAAIGTLVPGLYPAPFMELALNAIEPFLK